MGESGRGMNYPALSDALPQLASPAELEPFLRRTAKTIRAQLKSGELPGVLIGGRWFVHVPKLRALLDAGPDEPPTTGSRSEGPFRDVHPSPPAGSGSSSPGGGVPSAPGPMHGLDKGAVAPTPRGARSGGSPSLDRRSA